MSALRTVVIYLSFLCVGIPWYWPAESRLVVAGVPAWVAVAVLASIAAAIFTARLLARPWPDEREGEGNAG